MSWGGFVAQIPLVERLLCSGEDGLDLELVRNWEHRAIVLPGPSYVNFVAIAGYELAGVIGVFLLPVILLTPGAVLVCTFLALSNFDANIQKFATDVDKLAVFVIAAGLAGGSLRFLQRGSGSRIYAVTSVAFLGLVFVGVNPGLSLGILVIGSIGVKSGAEKVISKIRSIRSGSVGMSNLGLMEESE